MGGRRPHILNMWTISPGSEGSPRWKTQLLLEVTVAYSGQVLIIFTRSLWVMDEWSLRAVQLQICILTQHVTSPVVLHKSMMAKEILQNTNFQHMLRYIGWPHCGWNDIIITTKYRSQVGLLQLCALLEVCQCPLWINAPYIRALLLYITSEQAPVKQSC